MNIAMRTSSADIRVKAVNSFTRSLRQAVSQIDLEFIAGEEKLPFYCMDSVEIVDLDTDAVILTGRVDIASDAISKKDHSLSAPVSSLTACLVDSDALPKQFKNVSVDKIVDDLSSEGGVTVLFEGDATVIDKFVIEPGEKYFDAIERITRKQQSVIYDNENGELIIKRFASAIHTGQKLEYGSPDVLSINSVFDSTIRYSDYVCLGQLQGTESEEGRTSGVYLDRLIPVTKRLVIQMEEPADNAACAKRAEWEARQRYGDSCILNVSVPSWYKRDGGLWRVGELIDVDYPKANIYGDEFIIEEISGTWDKSAGSGMTLTIKPSGAYSFDKEINSIGYL